MKISAEVLLSLWNDVVILQKIQIRKASFKTTQANISFGRLDFSNWTKTMGNRDAWKSWLKRAPIFFLSYKISHFLLYKIFLLLSYKQLGMPVHTFRMSSFERLPLYQKGLPWTKRGPVVASLERTDAATCGKFQTTYNNLLVLLVPPLFSPLILTRQTSSLDFKQVSNM